MLDIFAKEFGWDENYTEWLRGQQDYIHTKKIKGKVVSEISISKRGLVITAYTLPEYRGKGYFTELLEKVEKKYNYLDFWTFNDSLKIFLNKRKGWEYKEDLNNYKRFIWQTQDGNLQAQ